MLSKLELALKPRDVDGVALTVIRSQLEDAERNITRKKRNKIFVPAEENEEVPV